MSLANVSVGWQQVAIGAIIVGGLLVDRMLEFSGGVI
jgi:ribose/xylose/arabinose/galactoside ABC-type transport system permease subunit